MKKIIASLLLAFISTVTLAQTYNGPESVEYDPTGNRYFISNSNNGQILSRASDGILSVFATGISPDPYGLEMAWGNLYACCGGKIYGYDLSNGSQIFNVNLGATFLNGLAHDNNGNLYATDFSAKKIYRINITNSSFNVFVPAAQLPASPNGIIWDQAQNRLVFVSWTGGAIKAVSLVDSSVTTLVTTTLSSCDGIAEDGAGNFYVSAWGGQKVVKFNNDFTSQSTVMSSLSSPADIFYNIYTDTLAVPNSGNNTVVFQSFAPATSITICDSVPLTAFVDSVKWETADAWSADSMISISLKNTSNYSFAYPEIKFSFPSGLPSFLTLNSNSQTFQPVASAWNPGVMVPGKCFFDVTGFIPSNYILNFTLSMTNLSPSNVDTCSFDFNFSVNLNPEVGVNEIDEQNFSIYPNPVVSQLAVYILQQAQHDMYTISICDVLGRKVFSEKLNSKSQIINLETVTPGVYFISILNSEEINILNRKILKE